MSGQGTQGAKVLFVDDEEAIRRLFETYLAGEGFSVRGAATLSEALDELDHNPPEVVVVDKNLPDGSGLQVLHACRTKFPDVEVIVLTGYPSLESAIDALRLGAFDYIIKPVLDLDLVSQKLRRALERRNMRLEERRRSQEHASSLDRVQTSLDSALAALREGRQDELKAHIDAAVYATRLARSSLTKLRDGDAT
jgi:DNA-binding NtrC family response regulator